MKERDKKTIVIEIILTIVAVGQIVLAFVLYNKNGNVVIRNTGWIILWISAIFGWLPIYTFKRYGKVPKGKSYVYTTGLVDRGIYRIIRHPQYFAGILIGLGLFFIAQHWLVGILGVMSIIIYYYSSFDEEKAALKKFGEKYQAYMIKVPRFNFVMGIIRLFYKSEKK